MPLAWSFNWPDLLDCAVLVIHGQKESKHVGKSGRGDDKCTEGDRCGVGARWAHRVWVPVASADAVGSACNDWMKISTDSGSGERIFCAQARPGDPDSPLAWLAWDSPSANWGPCLWSARQQVLARQRRTPSDARLTAMSSGVKTVCGASTPRSCLTADMSSAELTPNDGVDVVGCRPRPVELVDNTGMSTVEYSIASDCNRCFGHTSEHRQHHSVSTPSSRLAAGRVRLCPVWLWGRYGGSADADSPLGPALELLGGCLPAPAQIGARSIRCSVMPGCFDEQPADMTVTGLGDPALG